MFSTLIHMMDSLTALPSKTCWLFYVDCNNPKGLDRILAGLVKGGGKGVQTTEYRGAVASMLEKRSYGEVYSLASVKQPFQDSIAAFCSLYVV